MDLPPTTDVIRLEIDGPVVTVTLDRAPKYNAMNVEMIEGLISVLSWVKEHAAATVGDLVGEEGRPRPRILHLQAEGRHFCAGADIHMMRGRCVDTRGQSSECGSVGCSVQRSVVLTMLHDRIDSWCGPRWWGWPRRMC